MKREVGEETAELLGVFMNKIAPFGGVCGVGGNKGNPSEPIKQFVHPPAAKTGQQKAREIL